MYRILSEVMVLSASNGTVDGLAFSGPLMWAIVAFVAIIVEMSTVALVSIWFIPGALLALLVSFIPGCPVWVQTILFTVLTVICFALFRKRFKEKFGKAKVATNADAVIGKTGVVTESINNIEGKGAVKIMGREWSARSENEEDSLAVGDLVDIIRIEGVKLICKKVNR